VVYSPLNLAGAPGTLLPSLLEHWLGDNQLQGVTSRRNLTRHRDKRPPAQRFQVLLISHKALLGSQTPYNAPGRPRVQLIWPAKY